MELKGSVFSLGYQQRSVEEFVAQLLQASVEVVIDVRETPWSHKPGFSKSQLATYLGAQGIEYVHARFAGNPKRIRRDARTHDECLDNYEEYLKARPEIISRFDSLLVDLLSQGKNVCLVCYERHPGDCHRTILLDMWQDAVRSAPRISHLGPDGLPRLSTSRTDIPGKFA